MTARVEFLTGLRAGLRGAPDQAVDEVIADYLAHFDEGTTAGRSEVDIAAALGDPLALADELRVEFRISNWQASPSPRSALNLIAGSIAFGAINTVLLFVVGPLVLLLALATLLAVATLSIAGIWFGFTGASLGLPGGIAVALLCGLGLVSAAVSLAAVGLLAGRTLVDAFGRYARLHYKLLPRRTRPGLSP